MRNPDEIAQEGDPPAEALDHETRTVESDHLALRLWLRVFSCTSMIETDLRRRLRQGFDCTLPRFDLLAQLDRHPEGLKMRDLSRRLMVTGGNITGLTDKLVDEGLVERCGDPRDRRVYTIRLTNAGRRLFQKMARSHEQWVIELFNDLEQQDKVQLFELLGTLKSRLRTRSETVR